MNDLEMSKAITLLNLQEKFPHATSIEWDERQNVFWVETTGFSSWPLLDAVNDLSVNCMLSDKYEVSNDTTAKYLEVYFEGNFYRNFYEEKEDLPRARIEIILNSRGLYIKSNNMMRDIKFRAWDPESELMSNPFTPAHNLLTFEFMGEPSIIKSLGDECIMQFTGLTDKNGVDIYEGDIVYLSGYGDYKVEFPFLELYEAVMENDIGEIKGNTHQNPELIHN